MKYSKTTLMELSHKYRSILKRCAFLNAAILLSTAIALPAAAEAPHHNYYSGTNLIEDEVTFAGYDGTNSVGQPDGVNNLGGAIVNMGTLTFDKAAEFNGNAAVNNGGAIFSEGLITFNDEATFDGNTSKFGGAIFNSSGGGSGLPTADIIFKDKVTFKNNTATIQGGAISNSAPDSITFEKLATFTNNYVDSDEDSDHSGNVIFNSGKLVFQEGLVSKDNKSTALQSSGINSSGTMTVIGGDIEITGNEAAAGAGISNSGTLLLGAYLNGSSGIVVDPVDKITFKDNKALKSTAGALYAGGTTKLYANTILFEGNSNNNNGSSGAYGGAIALQGGTLDILGATNTFNSNHSYATATGDYATKTVKFGGGAIQNRGNTTPSNITIGADENSINSFTGNTSAMHGGAIHARAEGASDVASTVFYGTTSFTSNEAALNGGAISNSPISGTSTFTFNGDTSFSNNSASGLGGAIYNAGSMTFNGATVFSGNTDSSGANDIYNAGTINFNGDVTLDGGIVNTDGVLNFKSGTTLTLANVLNGSTIISGGTINANSATVDSTSFVVSEAGTYTFADSEINGEFVASDSLKAAMDSNLLYDVTYNNKGTFTVAERSEADIAGDIIAGGATAQEANTAAAVADADSAHPVVAAITQALQTGNVAAVAEAAKELAPTTSQQVMGVAQGINGLLSNVTGSRMAALGKSGGDAFIGGSTWVQGLYNHSKQDASGANAGFSANTKGIAFGIDGKANEALTLGIGYGYTRTDASSQGRKVDVDGHNIFVYGQYQPEQFYVNTMLSYGFSEYTEKKNPMGVAMKAKYDVNTFAANVMTGYDFTSGITPEGGLRYLRADQETYNDGAQQISTDASDVLTAVAGVKYTTDVKTENWTFKPTLRLAATYDVKSDNSKANVNVIGGGNYQITGDRLHRFGVETGVGVTSTVKNWDLTLEYNGGFRKDFQSHTGMLKAKYNF